MLEKTGVPTSADIDSVFPDEQRLKKGPVAVIECFEEIPCNPCQNACHRNAIMPFVDINHLPRFLSENCNGCGLCISKCPGLAIITVNLDWSDDKALMCIPYEFEPLPHKGEILTGLDRSGAEVAPVEIVSVINTEHTDKTSLVSFSLDKKHIKVIRNIKRKKIETTEDAVVLCRCSDLDLTEIRRLIKKGYTSIDELKRAARLGMGPCQGRTCIPLALKEISMAVGKPISELSSGTYRPLVKSIPMGMLADYQE